MGRYYSGDIEGKFWFVQSSNCANRFGSYGQEPSYIEYYFDSKHLLRVKTEIQSIENYLGDKKELLDKFFEKNVSYNDSMLAEIGVTKFALCQYADLLMGYQIKECIEETGECNFTAEL
jgi:hypothetical protein